MNCECKNAYYTGMDTDEYEGRTYIDLVCPDCHKTWSERHRGKTRYPSYKEHQEKALKLRKKMEFEALQNKQKDVYIKPIHKDGFTHPSNTLGKITGVVDYSHNDKTSEICYRVEWSDKTVFVPYADVISGAYAIVKHNKESEFNYSI